MSKIRIVQTGTISYLSSILGIVTGLIFITIITRNLTINEFGIWQILGSLYAYAAIPNIIPNYWAIRRISRGQKLATTAIITNIFLIIIGCFVYLSGAYILDLENTLTLYFILIGAVLIPLQFMFSSLKAITMATKPHLVAYSSIILEITKVIAGYYFISIRNLGFEGLIIAVAVAMTVQIGFLLLRNKENFYLNIDINEIKTWFRTGWLPIYTDLTSKIILLDVIVIAVIVQSTEIIALYKSAYIFAGIIFLTIQFANVLRIKLLAEGGNQDIQLAIRLMMIFTVPIAFGAIILSEPLLFILDPMYISASAILQVLAFGVLLYTFSETFNVILVASDKTDQNGIRNKLLQKSELVHIPTLDLVGRSAYILALAAGTLLFMYYNFHELIGLLWAFLFLVLNLILSIYKWNRIIFKLKVAFPVRNLVNTTISSILMVILVSQLKTYIVYNQNILSYIWPIIGIIIIGAVIYFLILFIIDKEFRNLTFKAIDTVR